MKMEKQPAPKEETRELIINKISEDTFMTVQCLVLGELLGEGDPEKVDFEVANKYGQVPVNAEYARGFITEYLNSIDWADVDWNNPNVDKRVKGHVKEMANKLLVEIGGSLTKQ